MATSLIALRGLRSSATRVLSATISAGSRQAWGCRDLVTCGKGAWSRAPLLSNGAAPARLGRATLGWRGMCMSPEAYNKRIQDVNDQFAEARLLIEDALDSNGTTYFEEDLADAQVAVAECLKLYTDTIAGLDDKRKGETQRSMGMKMEQLKGELAQIVDALTNDEELPPGKGS